MFGKMNVAAAIGVAVALVGYMAPADAVCSNGIAGVQATSVDVCCVEACGQCGGPGCDPGNSSTLTAADCCSSEIEQSGVLCDVTGTAPCIITTASAPEDSICDNGQTGVQDPDTDVCCPLECGDMCGGTGCGSIPGVEPSQCCAAAIIASGAVCSDSVSAPCVVEAVAAAGSNSTCESNGFPGIEDSGACCALACGQCGGAGCGNVAGLSGTDCCSAVIGESGELCSVTGAAPCLIDLPDVTPSVCPNGLAGVQDGTVCCAESCNGICGGVGCGSIAGTNGPSDCCSATILAAGVSCDDGVEAPCIMANGTYTDAPTASPVAGATVAPTAGSRGFGFSMAPTVAGQTMAPTAGSRALDFTGVPTSAPTIANDVVTAAPTVATRDFAGETFAPTAAPSLLPGETMAPGNTLAPAATPPGSDAPTETANGASATSSGSVVTLAALAAGAFAIYAAARE